MTSTPSDPQATAEAGRRLDRHHPADSQGTLSSCSKCGFLVTFSGTQEIHLPTATSLPEVERLLGRYDWPTDAERLVHRAIAAAMITKGSYPVSVDEVVDAIWPGYAQQVKNSGLQIEPLTPMVSHVIGADGRWGRLQVEESANGHHLVYGIVLDASGLLSC